MNHRTTRRRMAAVLGIALAALVAVAPAAAAADDDLDQRIDANQQQGTGQVVLDRGHVDFGPTLNTGEWIIQAHDDTASPSYWRHLDDVVMKVGDSGILTVPDDDAFAFLGAKPGASVWVIPQTQAPDVVWTGWNTQEPTVLDRLDRGATMTVHGVDGPGDVTVYLQSGNFGDPEPLWSTRAAFPQQTWIEVNTHTHANWVFTAPGIYLVDVEFAGTLDGGRDVSARDTLRFAVGDATSAEQAFGMTASSSTAPTAVPTKRPAAGATADATPWDLSTVVWIVVGVIAAVLVVAVIIVVTATRRARRRALAAREPGR